MSWFRWPRWLTTKFPGAATAQRSTSSAGRSEPPAAEFLRAIVESSDDAIIGNSLDGTVLSWNSAAERLYGYPASEMLGQDIAVLIPPNRQDELPSLFARVVAGEHIEHYETVRRRKGGSLVDVSMTISPILGELDRVVGVSAISRDITARKRAERTIEHRAFHDPLTDLPNRVLLDDRILGALARAQRRGASVAILFLDLDNFKRINDDHGHTTGDQVLTMLGPRLQAVLRPDDTLARFGGDEFVIVCADIHGSDKAEAIADRIDQALALPFDVGGKAISISASIGVTLGTAGDKPDELLGQADAAMYSAKRRDRPRIKFIEISRENDDPSTTEDT